MAGCACEQEQSLYNDIADFQTKRAMASLGYDEPKAREVARNIVDRRRSVDERYKAQDELGLEGVGPVFRLTENGDVYFPEFDGYLGDMYERQKALRPHEYNTEEHALVTSAYRALQEGATQSAHIVHHRDANGNIDIRDAVVLTYDRATNTGRMHILNISHEGKTHAGFQEARHALAQRLTGFSETTTDASSTLLIRTEKPVEPLSLLKAVPGERSESLFSQEQVAKEDKHQIGRERIEYPLRAYRNADQPEKKVPFVMPAFLRNLVSPSRPDSVGGSASKKETVRIVVREKTHDLSKHEGIAICIQKENHALKGKARMVALAGATGIGIGGAIHTLKSMETPGIRISKKEKKIVRKEYRKQKRKREKEAKRLAVEKNSTRKMKKRTEIISVLPKRGEQKKLRRMKPRELSLHPIREKAASKLSINTKKESAVVFLKRKERKRSSIALQLINIINSINSIQKEKSLRNELPVITAGGERVRAKKETPVVRQEKKVHVLPFLQAFLLYALLSLPNRQRIAVMQENNAVETQHAKETGTEEREPVLWVLLSIIWHMTAIREQGRSIYLPKKKLKKNRKRKSGLRKRMNSAWTAFPTQGVLYAYGELGVL